MSNGSHDDCAIVFSCDEHFIPLARGLVLSLSECGYPSATVKLCLIHIDCADESVEWMRRHGVRTVRFNPSALPSTVVSVVARRQYPQILRPWLTEIFPDINRFIWFDSDTWCQTGDAVTHMRSWLSTNPPDILLAPIASTFNHSLYVNLEFVHAIQRHWLLGCYDDPSFVDEVAKRLFFNSGVFAMCRRSAIWKLWRSEIAELYPRVAKRGLNQHLTEQTALNAVIARTGSVSILDPVNNFVANAGGAGRDPGSGLVKAMLAHPPRTINLLHLGNWSRDGHSYAKHGLLYQRGRYLTDQEWSRLLPQLARAECDQQERSSTDAARR